MTSDPNIIISPPQEKRFESKIACFSKYFLIMSSLVLLSGCAINTNSPAVDPVDRCAGLALPKQVTLEETPGWILSEGLPKYCKVRGTIATKVKFEMRLPEDWNGRFMMAGCGGFCGELQADSPLVIQALKRGYAAIAHDSGHQAPSWQTRWAYDDPEALELWAHKILPVVAETGVAITQSMYGKAPHHKYFSGCSNGGRLGLMAAQRYPDLFDGIAAGGPIFDLSGIAGLWGNWMTSQTYEMQPTGLTPVLQQSKVPFIKQAVMQQCDGVDGQVDHIIRDPRACQVDFLDLQCQAGSEEASCLSADEANMLNRLYGDVKNDDGETVYPALSLSSEHYSGMWLFGSEGQPGFGVSITQQYLNLLSRSVTGQEAPPVISSDEIQQWISQSALPAITDAVDPDLSGIHHSGTKLFIYQGWSDPLVIPEPMVNYYQQAAEQAGGMEKLQSDARLFMVPGMGHCWEIPAEAPVYFDPLLAVEQWVEMGLVPEFVVASQQTQSNELARSRPICAYPGVAELIQDANPDEHESYRCVASDPLP